jgi:hypothetical protein
VLVILAYTPNPLQVFLIGAESKRIQDLRVLAKGHTKKASDFENPDGHGVI